MKTNKLELNDFELFEKQTDMLNKSFQLYPEVPLISVTKNGIGFGKNSIDFLKLTDKNSYVIVLKKDDIYYLAILSIYYLAILSIDSKLNGYVAHKIGKNNMHASFRADKRGLDLGYYKLLEPIFVSGLVLFELEQFDLHGNLV